MILAAEHEFCYAVYVFDYIDVIFLVRRRGYLLFACAHSELYSQRGDFARQLRSRLFVFERYFAEAYAEVCDDIRGRGFAAMPVCSHDIWRLNRFDRSTPAELKTMLTFFFTMPWTPIVYYGEEIGMRNIEDAPVKEGSFSSRNRSSCRTPMQWDSTPNAGFSTAAPELLYLPIDPSPARPTVAAQIDDPASVLSYVKQLIALHKSTPALGTGGTWQFLSDPDRPYPMVYLRQKDGERYIVALNPTRRSVSTISFLPMRPFSAARIFRFR